MGILVNPDNLAFQVALNSEIYVDKSGLIKYTNKVFIIQSIKDYIMDPVKLEPHRAEKHFVDRKSVV